MRIMAINRKREIAMTENGVQLKMQNFVDRFGDDIDDAFEAVSAIAQLPDGRWIVIDLEEFETVLRN